MKKIIAIDCMIIMICFMAFRMLPHLVSDEQTQRYYMLGFLGVAAIVVFDLIVLLIKYGSQWDVPKVQRTKIKPIQTIQSFTTGKISEIALLNEYEQVIKTWELTGRTSLLIGRKNKLNNVDIDLDETQYSALVDYTHAVLNYAMQEWFIEDLNSKNGISIRKKQDGGYYKLAKDRPCKLSKGDYILIANTKLLVR